MTLSRNDVSFSEIGLKDNVETYKLTGIEASMVPSGDPNNNTTFKPGVALVATANEQAGLGSDGDRLLGGLATIEADEEIGGVQTGKYVKFAYSGSAPAIDDSVVVDGDGNVKTTGSSSNGTVVVSVDSTNGWVDVLIR